ncbi:MAG: 30S ribosomal protein S4 [Patescibacteria group bacterium]
MSINDKCRICRRAGEKLFLKGEKCFSQKCSILRKPYAPGVPPKRRKSRSSEYGIQLREAQKLKKTYGIDEKQFKRIVKGVLKKRGKEDVSRLLLKRIEKRISNVIFRVGLAKSRRNAQQLVSHAHFSLNGKKINISSQEVKLGDEIKLSEKSKKNNYFKKILPLVKKESIPSWLSFDKEKGLIKVAQEPKVEEIGMKINIPLVLVFYSK